MTNSVVIIILFLLLKFTSLADASTNISVVKTVLLNTEANINSRMMPVYCQINLNGAAHDTIEIWQNKKMLLKQVVKSGDNDVLFFANLKSNDPTQPITIKTNSQSLKVRNIQGSLLPNQINLVQHTHTDIGYTRPQSDILAEHLKLIDYALDYCDQTDTYPDEAKFRWTCEVTWPVEKYLLSRPKPQIERLKRRVLEGRIELAGMYLNFSEIPDEQACAASLAPLATIKKHHLPVNVAFQNDVNGISWSFIDFFSSLGIRYLTMGTHGHRALIPFETPTAFWWESPSGNRMLAYRADHYHQANRLGIHTDNFELFEKNLLIYLYKLESAGYAYDLVSLQFSGYYADNSPPSIKACEMIKKWNQKYKSPQLVTSTTESFLKKIESNYGNELKVFKAAWPDWWTDGFGSGAREVSKIRSAQTEIVSAQQAFSMACLLGDPIPSHTDRDILMANDAILFYDEHTFGFHASISSPYCAGSMEQRALKESYAWEALRRAKLLTEESLGLLQSHVPRQDVPLVAVFNPMGWARSSLVRIFIDEQHLPLNTDFKIVDDQGSNIPVQTVEMHQGGAYYLLWVDNVPAFSWKTLKIISDKNGIKQIKSNLQPRIPTLDNKWYTLKIDTTKGVVTSLFDKELNAELVDSDAPWQLGEIIYERPKDRNQINKFHLEERLNKNLKWMQDYKRFQLEEVKFLGVDRKPIWTEMNFAGKLEMAAFGNDGFKMAIRLYHTTKRIDFVYSVVKKPVTEPEAIYVAFPFKLNEAKVLFDVQGGVIEAGVEQIPGSSNDWNTVQNFISLKNTDSNIVIGSHETPLFQLGGINTGRYNADAKPEKPYIMGWPMNNYWVTNFAVDQRGEFEWSYYFTSGSKVSNDFAVQFGYNARTPFYGRIIPPGKASGYATQHVLDEFPDNVLLVNAKPASEGNGIIVQVRELNGINTSFLPEGEKIFKLSEVNVLGQILKSVQKIELSPFETKFVMIKW